MDHASVDLCGSSVRMGYPLLSLDGDFGAEGGWSIIFTS